MLSPKLCPALPSLLAESIAISFSIPLFTSHLYLCLLPSGFFPQRCPETARTYATA